MSVYAWGFGKLGQLGNGQTDTVHTPNQPKLRKPAVQINSGGYFTAIITNCGELWTFGCGKYGRLGTGSETDSTEPVKIKCVDNSGNVKLKLVSFYFLRIILKSLCSYEYVWLENNLDAYMLIVRI